jgi:hypothetical protein
VGGTENREKGARKELSARVNGGRNKVGKREEKERRQKWKEMKQRKKRGDKQGGKEKRKM